MRLRNFLAAHEELAKKLAELERKLSNHDEQIVAIIETVKRLMVPPGAADKRRIGFQSEGEAPEPEMAADGDYRCPAVLPRNVDSATARGRN